VWQPFTMLLEFERSQKVNKQVLPSVPERRNPHHSNQVNAGAMQWVFLYLFIGYCYKAVSYKSIPCKCGHFLRYCTSRVLIMPDSSTRVL
jgi:hypothetical protein